MYANFSRLECEREELRIAWTEGRKRMGGDKRRMIFLGLRAIVAEKRHRRGERDNVCGG